ncbi:GAF domain-containing protein [Dysgonomonas sp. BGC7]|uniref:GAF domain-containing protein n=1 Tax=Dysgonomonas sp. BGC7 TaxID=1658008 RepID=UPI000682B546|nr:GAF domain-containing protein [Dysgonomonas sp. BGC7]MBD8389767.1 GAF domain-containing protein [Dysgonomonas sp. BGC7]
MAESLLINNDLPKEEKYKLLLPQLKALIEAEPDTIANMANISSALKMTFGFFWVGFYIVKREELVLGPFQGTIACTRIKYGKGVCGTAWKEKRIVIVEDVDQFPGHIACDANSRSEIVLPLFDKDEVFAVLDIDSNQVNHFDATDAHYLEEIVRLIEFQY